MNEEIKKIADEQLLVQLYQNNLFSLKSICQLLGAWDNYSPKDQFTLENFTKRDSNINKHFTYEGVYNKNYTYGEVLRSGTDIIIEKINRYKKPNSSDVFIDIGSGSGKLVIHTAIKTEISTLIGIEIVPQRVAYSKYIKDKFPINNKAIFFIEKDIKDFDLSIVNIAFMNNLTWDRDVIYDVYNRLKKGCHIISSIEIPECKILKEEFYVDASWGMKLRLHYYIK